MKLSAILSVATLLPLVLATAAPSGQCKSCNLLLDEYQRCDDKNSETARKDCLCNSSMISLNFNACASCSNDPSLDQYKQSFKELCGHFPGASSKTTAGYFMLGGMAAAAGVAAFL